MHSKQSVLADSFQICDATLKARALTLKSIEEKAALKSSKKADLAKPDMDQWSDLGSVTMLHEVRPVKE